MKKFSKLVVSFLVICVLVFSFSFADTPSNETNLEVKSEQVENVEKQENAKKSSAPIDVETVGINTEKVEQGIEDIANKGESLAYKIVEQISDKSLPVCAILILWGAVLYFILGIRNLYKKRQGLLLMWGAFTFVVIAKIMNFAFWFAFIR